MTHTTLHAKESQPAMAPDRRNRRLHRIVMTAMMIGASVMLAGCGTNKDNMSTGAIPDDYRTRHPITLNEVEHTLDIPIASGDHRLSNGVQDSIGGFATDYLSTSSGSIQIMLPQGSANAGAAANVRAQIRKVLTANHRDLVSGVCHRRRRSGAPELCRDHGRDQPVRRMAGRSTEQHVQQHELSQFWLCFAEQHRCPDREPDGSCHAKSRGADRRDPALDRYRPLSRRQRHLHGMTRLDALNDRKIA